MSDTKNYADTWFDRIKKEIDKHIEPLAKEEIYPIRFKKMELLPTIRLLNADHTNFIDYKVDEKKGEIYKECLKLHRHTGEPYRVRVVYESVEMFLDDMRAEITKPELKENFISGWVRW